MNLDKTLNMDNTSRNGSTIKATCAITESQMHFYEVFSWWLGGIGSTCVSIFGIILNTIAVFILCNKKMRSSFFNRLLVCLVIVDNIFLMYGLLDAIGMQLMASHLRNGIYNPFVFVYLVYPARNIVMCISIYMTVGLAYERYTSISDPIMYRNQENRNCRRLIIYIFSVVTFSICYCLPKFFELKVEALSCVDEAKNSQMLHNETLDCSSLKLEWRPTQIRENPIYILWYINISNLAVTCFIPFILLSFFNYKIYTSLKQRYLRRASMVSVAESSNRQKEIKHTFVLFAIVAMFVICHILRVILNVEELGKNLGKSYEQRLEEECANFWAVIVMPISTILLQINSSSNFFIYCFFDDMYRELLKSSFLKIPCNTVNLSSPIQMIQRTFVKSKPRENHVLHKSSPCDDIEMNNLNCDLN